MSSVLLEFNHTTLQHHLGNHLSSNDLTTDLHIENWQIRTGQHWAIVGGNDVQRNAIRELVRLSFESRRITENEQSNKSLLKEISLAEQEQFIQSELIAAKTGAADELFQGTLISEILKRECGKSDDLNRLVAKLEFQHGLDKRFRQLSSGETRRVLLICALATRAEMLLLQDPLEGLDHETRPIATQLIIDYQNKLSDLCSIFIASRIEQLPKTVTNIAVIYDKKLTEFPIKDSLEETLTNIEENHIPKVSIVVPALPKDHPFHKSRPLIDGQPLVKLSNVKVQYADMEKPIFDHLNWTIAPLEHWRVTGKNGSGKTTLLKLITGDHPQVYNNDIEVCGFKRGSGESVWDVKRHIGYMGGEMLWNYRSSGQLAGKAKAVIMSGLYDSIGLYAKTNAADNAAADAWLNLFELDGLANTRFNRLGMAEQRLVLIARAMIKRPSLLILDEPLQGLDENDRQRVLTIIEKLLKSGATTLLYVSHHEDEQVQGVSRTLSL